MKAKQFISNSDQLIGSSLSFENYVEKLGQRVAQTRNMHRMTQEQCASQAQISRASLANLEAGRGDPKISTLLAISATLKIPLSMLILGIQSDAAEVAEMQQAMDSEKRSEKGVMASNSSTIGVSSGSLPEFVGGAPVMAGFGGGTTLTVAPVAAVGCIAYGLFKLLKD